MIALLLVGFCGHLLPAVEPILTLLGAFVKIHF